MWDRPRLGRSMFEDYSDRGLGLLSHQLLREACHFQQIVENEVAYMIECGFERNHEFGIQRASVYRHRCA